MVNGEYIYNGPSYLIILIELTYVNTKANVTAARDKSPIKSLWIYGHPGQ